MATTSVDQVTGYGETVAYKAPCRLASTADITLSGLQTIDGSLTVADDRVLVKDQTDARENGIYIASTGLWSRARDMDSNRDLTKGTRVSVTDGTAGAASTWEVTTSNPVTVGTANITFSLAVLSANQLIDEDDMASNSATKVPSQQSVKAYVDTGDAAAAAALTSGLALKLAKASNLSDVADQVASQNNLNYQRVPANATYAIIAAMTKMSQRADLRDWSGLDLTGVNDNATLVQAAVTAMAAAGQKLHVPAGDITLGSTITVPVLANIEGPGQPADRNGAISANAAYFHLAHLGAGFNLTGNNDGARRLAGFGTYRDQPAAGGGWTPLGALADVQFSGVYDAIVEDLFFLNPTKAINAVGVTSGPNAGAGNGRLTVRRLRGQAMQVGMQFTHVYDTIYVDDVHWWPYFSMDANILAYMKANAFACILGRVDWPQFGRIFSWGMHDGLYFQNQASVGLDGGLPPGVTTHFHADSIGVDNCERGIVIEAAASGVSASIDRLTCTNTVYAASAMVTLAGNNARVVVADQYLANTDGNAVTITGTGNDVTIGKHRSSGIDHDAGGTPEFNVATGNTLTLLAKPITSAATVYAFAGTGRIRTPDWINFTPTVSASTGTITTVAAITAGDCKYKLEGTTCIFDYTITITTNGTGAGAFQATLPFAAKRIDGLVHGKTATQGLNGIVQTAVARVDLTKYDGTYPGADGAVLRFGGSFEIA